MKKIMILIIVMSLLGSSAIGFSGNETENSQQREENESSVTIDKQVNASVDNTETKCQKSSNYPSKSGKKECASKAAASKCKSGEKKTCPSGKPI